MDIWEILGMSAMFVGIVYSVLVLKNGIEKEKVVSVISGVFFTFVFVFLLLARML